MASARRRRSIWATAFGVIVTPRQPRLANSSTAQIRLSAEVSPGKRPITFVIAFVVGAGSVGGIVLFALAAVMLATSAVDFCPLYRLLHLDGRGRTLLPHRP